MKVISIGTDRKLFEEGSNVLARSQAYAEKMDELHIIVFTPKGYGTRQYGNLFIHPTNSFSRFMYVFDAYRIAQRLIRDRKLDTASTVVTCQDPFETGLVGSWIRRDHGFPLQIQVHTDFLSPFFKTSALQSVRVRMARYTIPRANGIRVVSSVIESSILQRFPHLPLSVDVLPIYVDIEGIMNAVPMKNIRNEFPEFQSVVLLASRLSSEKRIDIALRAFKRVLESSPFAGLVVCGDGPLKAGLESLSHDLGVSSNVRFVGWQDDLVSYFKTADMFVLTSEYEGYGMTLIEAGAAGCPIVTAKVGIAKTDLFVHGVNCSICEPCTESTVAEAISKMLADPAHRAEYATHMQEALKNKAISWDSYVSQYVQLLDKLL